MAFSRGARKVLWTLAGVSLAALAVGTGIALVLTIVHGGGPEDDVWTHLAQGAFGVGLVGMCLLLVIAGWQIVSLIRMRGRAGTGSGS
jgi:uncharacterized membrane protein